MPLNKLLSKLVEAYILLKPYRVIILNSIGLSTSSCRFRPSCSQYTLIALTNYGTIRGLELALKRFSRCHSIGKQNPT